MTSNAEKALARVDHATQVAQSGNSAPQTIADMLRHPAMQKQIQMALPRGMNADRILRIAMTALRQTPKLAACTPASFMGALFQSAQLGLEPSNGLGYAWLIPYGHDVTFIIGYRGLIELARRSGEISEIYAYPVYSADHFNYTLGLTRTIDHQPAVDGEPADKDLVAVYAVARFKDGGEDFEVMTRGQVDAIRKRSKASGNGPWVTDYAEMARKTVLKRLCKRLPLAVESQAAIAQDETIKTTLAADMTRIPDVSESPDVFGVDGRVVDMESGEVFEVEVAKAPETDREVPKPNAQPKVVSGAAEAILEPESPHSEESFGFEEEGNPQGETLAFSVDDPARPTTSADRATLSAALKGLPAATVKQYRSESFGGRSNSELTHSEAVAFTTWALAQTQ